MSAPLLTAEELAPMFRCVERTILDWRKRGIITASVHVGKTILFDPDAVREQLADAAKAKARKARKPVKLREDLA